MKVYLFCNYNRKCIIMVEYVKYFEYVLLLFGDKIKIFLINEVLYNSIFEF